MSTLKTSLALSLLSSPLVAYDYASIDLEKPWDHAKNKHWHIQGDYKQVAQQSFQKHRGHVHAAEGDASLYFSHYVSENNALSWEVGYDYLKFDWDQNPKFSQTQFQLALASLALVSKAVDEWRWIVNVGFSVDAERWDFGNSIVVNALMWGRYHHSKHLGLHIGFFGFTGTKTGYALPVLGLDWHFLHCFQLNLIFPLNLSLICAFNQHWFLSLGYVNLGGPYRFPWRGHGGEGKYNNSIFEIFAPGLELGLNFKWSDYFRIGAAAGWNFDSWIFIQNSDANHGKYYRYNAAPYGSAYLAATF